MSQAAQRRASYDDLIAVPAHLVAEIIYGTLVTSPRPAAPHAYAASVLGMDVGGAFQRGRGGPGGWWILHGPELHLEDNVLVPDLAGWRVERMHEVPNVKHFTLAPDWICEVLSPSTEAWDRTEKLTIYGVAGVAWAWLINPIVQTLEVLQNRDGEWALRASHRAQASVRAEPFEAIELALGDLWLPHAQG